MFRNLFAVVATLTLGGGAASASTATETKDLSLEQRVQAAQTKIDRLLDVTSEQSSKPGSKFVQYWSNYHYRPWNNWNNWRNWSNYYGGY